MSGTSPLPDGEVDHDPGDDEGAEELPAEAAHVLDALGHLEDAAVVELLRAGVGVVLGQTRVVGGQVSVHDGSALCSSSSGLLHCLLAVLSNQSLKRRSTRRFVTKEKAPTRNADAIIIRDGRL